jgi:hypothetical protein
MNDYESAVYITRDYEQPWGMFNSPFETMEKDFMNNFQRYFPESYDSIKKHDLEGLFVNKTRIEIEKGFIHIVKRDGNHCTRMVFYYNPNKDKPLLSKLQEEWLDKKVNHQDSN